MTRALFMILFNYNNIIYDKIIAFNLSNEHYYFQTYNIRITYHCTALLLSSV
jgi:hypothetical protein